MIGRASLNPYEVTKKMATKEEFETALNKMVSRFKDPEVQASLKGFTATILFDFKEAGKYTLWIEDGEYKDMKADVIADSTLKITMSADTFVKVINKQTNPIKEYTLGRIKTKGSMSDLLRLRKVMF